MATTHGNSIDFESDGAHVTFVKDCPHGLTADPSTGRRAESKWLSAATARVLIAHGFAVESDPTPKKAAADPQAAVLTKTGGAADALMTFRMLNTGDDFTMHWTVALDRIRKGVAELV